MMGACAFPEMMDEEVGVIIAGWGDRRVAVCRYGPNAQSEESRSDIYFAGSQVSYSLVWLVA